MGSEMTPVDRKIRLGHGSGGKLTRALVNEVFVDRLSNPMLAELDDSAKLESGDGRLAFTTDSFVVTPYIFPGGDIGKLSVCGTVNDLAVAGAEPKYLSYSLIIEEGFSLADLERIVDSTASACEEAGVKIVTGDTKVVARGNADGIFVTTAGVGVLPNNLSLGVRTIQPGDVVLINGGIGEHAVAVLLARNEFQVAAEVLSDCAPLNSLTSTVLRAGQQVRFMRDATRGGLATVLAEIAVGADVAMEIDEQSVPIRPEVRSVCDLLGFDPLYLANEGKVVVVVGGDEAEEVLSAMKSAKLGAESAIIGRVVAKPQGKVLLKTEAGGTRVIDMLVADQLPRIC